MPARSVRADEELRLFAEEHLAYEIAMLGALPGEIMKRDAMLVPSDSSGDAVLNGLVESFAVHARVVVDFFYRERPPARFPDDAVARDYFHDDPARWPIPEKTAEVTMVQPRRLLATPAAQYPVAPGTGSTRLVLRSEPRRSGRPKHPHVWR
jgi:hypothetical protein